MKRLFELGCVFSGRILSYNKILGQLTDAGNTTTLAHYLNLLDTSGLLKGIPKYSPGIHRQRASSPKFQVYNTALLSARQADNYSEVISRPDKWERWIESAGRAVGIEVKSGIAVKTSGMTAFNRKFKPFKMLLIGQEAIPWQEFLKLDPGSLFT
jgi:hypothetical protein